VQQSPFSSIQPSTPLDDAIAGTAPVVAGAKATTIRSQSVAARETQVATSAPPAGTATDVTVFENSRALVVAQPPLAPLPTNNALAFLGVKPNIADMTIDEKFACLKQTFAYGHAMTTVAMQVFDSIIAEFKTYKKNRPKDCPKVEDAFRARGLNYGSVRVAMSRYRLRIKEGEELFREAQRLSTANVHGLEITDDDLPTFTPMFKTGDEVATVNGNIGRFLKYGEKNAPGTEPSCDVEIDGVSTHFKSQNSLVLLADKLRAQEERKKKDEKAAERAAAQAAREDAAALSDNFYAMQFFNLINQINTA